MASSSSFEEYDNDYSLDNLPKAGSDVVSQEKQEILSSFRMQDLVDNLREIGSTARLAVYAASASGNATLQHQTRYVENQLIEVYNLCGASAQQYKLATKEIINIVETAIDLILNGKEEVAIKFLGFSMDVAGKASKFANRLANHVNDEVKIINGIIKQVVDDKEETSNSQEKIKNRLKQTHEQLTSQQREQQAKEDELQIKIDNMTNQYKIIVNDLEKRSKILDLLFSIFSSNRSNRAEKERLKKQKSEELCEARNDQQNLRDKVTELNQKIAKNSFDYNEATKSVYVDCLVDLHKRLSKASVTLQQAASFWTQIYVHCKNLADDKTKAMIQEYLEDMSAEERKELWQKPIIQKKPIKYYTQWLALHEVSSEFGQEICTAKIGVWKSLEQVPTRKEAIEAIKKLKEEAGEED